jgi:hypothetical protein
VKSAPQLSESILALVDKDHFALQYVKSVDETEKATSPAFMSAGIIHMFISPNDACAQKE